MKHLLVLLAIAVSTNALAQSNSKTKTEDPNAAFNAKWNEPKTIEQKKSDGSIISPGDRIVVSQAGDSVKFDVTISNIRGCTASSVEIEIAENHNSFKGVPTITSPLVQLCWGTGGAPCTDHTQTITYPIRPDTLYNWQARIRSSKHWVHITPPNFSCGSYIEDFYSSWKPYPADPYVQYAFGTFPMWSQQQNFQTVMGETGTVCGEETQDQDGSWYAFPPDKKYATYRTTEKPHCTNLIRLGWSAKIENKYGSKDEIFVAVIKPTQPCQGRIFTREDTPLGNEFTIANFSLKANQDNVILQKLNGTTDILTRTDFVTFIQRRMGSYGGFIPLVFECKATSDFEVGFDTVTFLHRAQPQPGQNFIDPKAVEQFMEAAAKQ
ncbi:hypothetical protein NLM27_38895 [Bradyrhizobium sp. CCGB12]|uniref:hypothetical protein n=1 Tax=Bradyrhizobium sp. CCGB12 TaxID=2949632 RepID=UPI0020B30428|nr:hypothetical protein [Bradyrhizobium sp. CCGB12]MCP3394725.1 hypothetical protein [Bradyrhizobium sp. CCGB12]